MDINHGRKILTEMQICFQEMDLPISREAEKMGDSWIVNHLSFKSWYKDEGQLAELVAVVVFEHDIMQLSMNFYPNNIGSRYPDVLELLNLINMERAACYWQLIPDYEKFEFLTAIILTANSLNADQFKNVLHRFLKLGPRLFTIIDRFLNSRHDPKDLLKKFKAVNNDLRLDNIGL